MAEGKKIKILVVEDNFMNKVLVKEMLSLEGYDVIEADSGEGAIERIHKEMPDIILMDLHLPLMDGVTATKIIKSKVEFKDIPIIALTASAMKGDEIKIMKEGFDGYVAKPIELKKLIATVKACLDRKAAV